MHTCTKTAKLEPVQPFEIIVFLRIFGAYMHECMHWGIDTHPLDFAPLTWLKTIRLPVLHSTGHEAGLFNCAAR